MSVFEINDDVLKKVWDSSGEQLYSVSGGKLFNAREFSDNDRPDNISQTQYFLQMGYMIRFGSILIFIRTCSTILINLKRSMSFQKLNRGAGKTAYNTA